MRQPKHVRESEDYQRWLQGAPTAAEERNMPMPGDRRYDPARIHYRLTWNEVVDYGVGFIVWLPFALIFGLPLAVYMGWV